MVKIGAFLPALSIQIVQAAAVGWSPAAGMTAWAAPVGLLFLAVVAIGTWTAGWFVKVRPATLSAGLALPRPAPLWPASPVPRAASAVRCPASHAACAPLRAPPTVLRTLRRFERAAELSGLAYGNNAAESRAPRQVVCAAAWSTGVAGLRAGPGAGACRPD